MPKVEVDKDKLIKLLMYVIGNLFHPNNETLTLYHNKESEKELLLILHLTKEEAKEIYWKYLRGELE